MAKVIAITNQKGGVGKTTTTVNLGIGLARSGKRVLLIDSDPQGSLSISLGIEKPDNLTISLATILDKIMIEEPFEAEECILHHEEGIDFLPGNIDLSGSEVSLINTMNRERVLKQYLDVVKQRYDYVLLDCMPSLGILIVNALVAADSVLIPVQTQYLSAKGLEQLLRTVNKVRQKINPRLAIDGILMTMVDNRTNYAKEIGDLLRETYGSKLNVFKTHIPHSVRASESSAEGVSIFTHDPKGRVSNAYQMLTEEVLRLEKQR